MVYFKSVAPEENQCVINEGNVLNEEFHGESEIVMPFVNRMFQIYEMPDDFGLWENGLIIRKTNPELEEFENLWCNLLVLGSHRDQLSMPFASFNTGVKIQGIDWRIMYSYFKKHQHLRK